MVLPTTILVPLYIYPISQAGSPTWTFLFDTISAYPSVSFTIVVNENSGPGILDSNGCTSDTNYLAAISNLTAFNNTDLVGYVRTGWALSPPAPIDISVVEGEIDTWHNYSLCPTHDTQINGIFFDEAPQTFDANTSAYMQQVASYAHSELTTVIFNPGAVADPGFFAYADNIVMREDQGSNTDNITATIDSIPAAERANSSILFHDWANLTEAIQSATVEQIVQAGVGGIFITTTPYNETNDDPLWPDFVQAVNEFVSEQ